MTGQTAFASPPLWRADADPAAEGRRVLIDKGVFHDDARDRDVPYKVYYPDGAEEHSCPVIIWSHGLGGSRDGAGFISRFLAGQGYVLIHVQHAGTDSGLWEGKPGHPWDIMRTLTIAPEATRARYHDIPFVLDQLPSWAAENPAGQVAAIAVLGMSGHSFGANTTQIMAGQRFGRGLEGEDLRETRFRAGILYSPVPSHNETAPRRDIYGAIGLPLFHMTGTDDQSPIEGFGYEKRLEVFENSGGPAQHLLVLQGGDHMVYNGSRGQLGENPLREVHESIIKAASLAYWDTYLKDDRAAKDWLTGGGFAAWLGAGGTYQFRA